MIHLDFRTFSHATEVEEKVKKALTFVSNCQEVSVTHSEGYHGNKILIMECTAGAQGGHQGRSSAACR